MTIHVTNDPDDTGPFDPYSGATLANPFPSYSRLLHGGAVTHYTREGVDFAVVGGYGLVKDVLGDIEIWSSKFGPAPRDLDIQNAGLNSDPPIHTEWRRIFGPRFGPSAIDKYAAGVEELGTALIDAMLTHHEGDLHDEFAMPLVVQTMAKVLGLPVDGFLDYKECADQVLVMTFNDLNEGASLESMQRAFVIFGEAIANRRKLLSEAGIEEPLAEHVDDVLPGDVISALMAGRWQGRPMTDEELFNAILAFFVGGSETASSLILNAVRRLLEEPDLWARVHREPDRVNAVIEESLRFDPPVLGLFRKAVRATELGGEPVEPSQRLMFAIAAANRDPAVFTDPDSFDIERDPKELRKHIAFGFGPHVCVGSVLARMEARVALRLLAGRVPALALAGQPARIDVFNYWGLKSLPATW
jgi:cytochrome P450